ncbi:MAG TPA: polysaccharide deacetylase family protein [Kofleriaceae bacterium]|nr:polysaccharide deacetylase family protein [Kofleriaceae bacterium]
MRSRLVLVAVLAAGCQRSLADTDGAFYSATMTTRVHCAVNLDSSADTSFDSIDSGLDRAHDRGEIVELYAHHPGVTVPIATIEHVLAGAQSRQLAFVTYADLAAGTAQFPGLALSFDDTSVDAWIGILPLLAQYDARVTFFVSRWKFLTDAEHGELQQLAAAGHAIEPHTVLHLRAPDYVEQYGLDAYMANEFQPSRDVLEGEGFATTAFAYPFGSRTDELDRALLEQVGVVRSVAFTFEGDGGPCPR